MLFSRALWCGVSAALMLLCVGAEAKASCSIPRPIDQPRTGAPNLSIYTNDYTVITGGCIDGTPIGQNTPAAGTFTTIGGATYFAKSYGGAVWDGASSHDVGPAINAAIAAAVTAGGGDVVCPAGNYYVATTIRVQNSYVGLKCGAFTGTQLIWNGSAAGRMVSFDALYGDTTKKRLVKNKIDLWVNGNGLAADGLYIASLFDFDIWFRASGEFDGGNVLNLDVVPAINGSTFGEAIDTQDGRLYSVNINVTGTSNQFKLGTFTDATGTHGNASFNTIFEHDIVGAAGTGILCAGCDNNVFVTGRVFRNGGTAIDLGFNTGGGNFFAANGNQFLHEQYAGSFFARGTPTQATCNAYTAPLPSTPCSYANLLNRDQTNGTPTPTIEAGADLQDGTNFGYLSARSFYGQASIRPALIASGDVTTVGSCEASALTNGVGKTFYGCNTSDNDIYTWDGIEGSRFGARLAGSNGAKNLQFRRLNGSGIFEFANNVQFDGDLLPNADLSRVIGGTSARFTSIAAQQFLSNNGSHSWLMNTNLGASGDGNLTFGHDGNVFIQAYSSGDVRLATGAAIATNAVVGFTLIDAMAGAPTGAPTNWAAGAIPIVIDTTNHKICWNETGAGGGWKCALGS